MPSGTNLFINSEKVIGTFGVRNYDKYNVENRVNIFLSMGQSNSVGIETQTNITANSNVFIPVEKTHGYPTELTFKPFTNNGLCKSDFSDRKLINTATKFAEKYNDPIPLYVVNIAREGMGIDVAVAGYDHWSMTRQDIDQKSLHPQSMHYIKTLMMQLQKEGKEPFVIGMDWNQWEAENPARTPIEFALTYQSFFNTFRDLVPNPKYKLFLPNPTSAVFPQRDNMRLAFLQLQSARSNTKIYDPATMGSPVFRDDVHYTEALHSAFADYMITNYER